VAGVVNIGSVAATAGLPDRVLYAATKGAVLAAARAMAADHIREGIRINCVNPGTAQTPWIDRLLAKTDDPEAELAALNARQPHGRLVTAGRSLTRWPTSPAHASAPPPASGWPWTAACRSYACGLAAETGPVIPRLG
jgi:NAD(P)-dependent dehydrogenase (short-subunit alcohol dehydrogenase family)